MDLTLTKVTFHWHICLYPTPWNLHLADLPQYLTISHEPKWRGSFAVELLQVSRTICPLPWKKDGQLSKRPSGSSSHHKLFHRSSLSEGHLESGTSDMESVCCTSVWSASCEISVDCWDGRHLVSMPCEIWDARTPPRRSNQIGCKARGHHSSFDCRAALHGMSLYRNEKFKENKEASGSKWHGRNSKTQRPRKTQETRWDHAARL